jgi:uncharacterized Rmd1/YagE family protein
MPENKQAINFDTNPQSVTVRACILGQRFNMRDLRHLEAIKKTPLTIKRGGGYAVIFRYGVVVLFGLSDEEQKELLQELKQFVTQPYDEIEPEEVDITCEETDKDRVSFDGIHVRQWDITRLLIIADIMAKSQVLSYHESRMSLTFDKIEPIAQEMHHKGYPSGRRTRDLLRHIALTLSAQRNITGQAEILDKPDFLWDQPPALEGFFVKLEDEYEIRERYDALKEKLDLIYRTSEMMLGLMNSRHTLHVEWYIVILIVIDIVIHLVETYVF